MEKRRLKKGLMLELGLIMTLKLAWCIKICKNTEGQYLNRLLNTAAKCKFIICMRPKSKEERGAKCSFPSLQKSLQVFTHPCLFQNLSRTRSWSSSLIFEACIFDLQPCFHEIPIEYLMSLMLTNMHCFQSIIKESEVNQYNRLSICSNSKW